MYEVDGDDRVRSLEDMPRSSVGAPLPLLLSDEHTAVIAYYLQDFPPKGKEFDQVAIVRFHSCYARLFGAPNDEAFAGHPLADRGLEPYGAFAIENSSWLRRLERMNAVHPHHQAERFLQRQHFVLSFHDTTFECIADGYSIEVQRGSVFGALPRMAELLD